MDENLKRLMKELGDAINESLSESEQIADAIARIKNSGYDVFLVLEATIGFNKRESEQPGPTLVPANAKTENDLEMTPQDIKFLKSLRISLDDAA